MGISKKTVGLIMGGALVGGAVYLLNKYRKETREDYTDIINRMFNQYGLGDVGCGSCDGCCLGHCGVGLGDMANEPISNQETTQTPEQAPEAHEQTTKAPEQTTQTNNNTVDTDERIDRFINAVHEVLKAFGTETKK